MNSITITGIVTKLIKTQSGTRVVIADNYWNKEGKKNTVWFNALSVNEDPGVKVGDKVIMIGHYLNKNRDNGQNLIIKIIGVEKAADNGSSNNTNEDFEDDDDYNIIDDGDSDVISDFNDRNGLEID